MIIVLGNVTVPEQHQTQALALSHEHVARSRREPGCIEHGVYQDKEVPGRLSFVERWDSMASLLTHFAVPASGAFADALAALASTPPALAMYEATEVPRRALPNA